MSDSGRYGEHGVVIVGAGLGAQSAVDHLRRNGFEGRITLVGKEKHAPYDRPPLSKEHLWANDLPAPRYLGPAGFLDESEVTFIANTAATGLDPVAKRVQLAGSESVPYDSLIIATGASARMLRSVPPGLPGVHTLRTFDDCLTLRAGLPSHGRMVVVGAGFIGCEVAGSAASKGIEVTVIDPLPVPLARSLGGVGGSRVARLQREAGVDLVTGVGVTEVLGTDAVVGVRLADGHIVDADAVLVALGASPELGWLSESGLKVGRGVVTDEWCATSAPDVYAIGDVAESFSPRLGRHIVVEHWMNARDQGARVAARILGSDAGVPGTLPYFWSEQAGVRIQALGHPDPALETSVVEWADPKPGAIILYGSDRHIVAAAGFNAANKLMRLRPLLQREAARVEFESAILGGERREGPLSTPQ